MLQCIMFLWVGLSSATLYTLFNDNTPHSEKRCNCFNQTTVHAQTRASSLLLWSEHRFGTKREVTPFRKPVDMCISFIERPSPLSSGGRFKYSEHTIEHLLKWPLVIYSRPVPYLALFVREPGDDEY